MGRHLVFAVAAVCFAALVVGCGSSTSSTPASSSAATPPASGQSSVPATSAVTPSGPVKVGEQLTAGPWQFTVREVSVQPEAPGQVKPPAGKELMFVQVDLYNSGSQTLHIKPAQFTLTDSSGATVKTFGKQQAYNAWEMSPLEPKYGTNTTFIYAVDPGSTGYTLTFSPDVNGQKIPLAVIVR